MSGLAGMKSILGNIGAGSNGSSNIIGNKILDSDQSFSNNDVFTDINEMSVSLEANTDYLFMFTLDRKFNTSGEWQFVIPTGATGRFHPVETIATKDIANVELIGSSAGERATTYKGVIMTSDAGVFKAQARQQTATVTTMDAKIGTSLVVIKEV